jgi:hypothetical protein
LGTSSFPRACLLVGSILSAMKEQNMMPNADARRELLRKPLLGTWVNKGKKKRRGRDTYQ